MDPKKMYKSKGKTSLPASKISRDKLRELAKKEGKTQLEMVDRIITHYHNEHMWKCDNTIKTKFKGEDIVAMCGYKKIKCSTCNCKERVKTNLLDFDNDPIYVNCGEEYNYIVWKCVEHGGTKIEAII